jgi:hypothetical protein
MMRYTRHLTIRLRHAKAALATYSAVEEHTDGSETPSPTRSSATMTERISA